MKPVKPTAKQTPKCSECGRKMFFWATGRAPKVGKRLGPWRFSFACGDRIFAKKDWKKSKFWRKYDTGKHDRIEATVNMTPVQVKHLKRYHAQMFAETKQIHEVSHAFQKDIKWGEWEKASRLAALIAISGKTKKHKAALRAWQKEFNTAVVSSAYPDIRALLGRAERASAKDKRIVVCSVDDDHFCGSDLVFVPHATKKKWMGLSVYHFPQCGGIPTRFFMYPDHVDGVIAALLKFQKQAKRLKELF